MKPRKLVMITMFAWFTAEWSKMMAEWLRTGRAPTETKWKSLELTAAVVLWWMAFDAAARLNHRANGEKFVIPPTSKGMRPQIDATIKANPRVAELLRTARKESFNVASQWRASEQKMAERLVMHHRGEAAPGKTKRFPKPDPELFEKSIDYRIRRFRRDRASRMVVAAENALLEDPAVGDQFPYAEYWTREDRRVRPTHVLMQGFIAQRTNEIWNWVTPACGYNCRCYRILRTIRESIARGWMTKDGKPLFVISWPNETAQANYRRGIPFHENEKADAVPKSLRGRVFPDPGPWMLSRQVAVTV